MPNKDENEQGSLKSTLGGLVLEGIQGTLKAAQDMKEYLYPEDLQKDQTNDEVVQELLRANYLAKQTMKSVT